VWSYAGRLNFGFYACPRALPDLPRLSGHVADAFEELVKIASRPSSVFARLGSRAQLRRALLERPHVRLQPRPARRALRLLPDLVRSVPTAASPRPICSSARRAADPTRRSCASRVRT
jgi:hypothetical protein